MEDGKPLAIGGMPVEGGGPVATDGPELGGLEVDGAVVGPDSAGGPGAPPVGADDAPCAGGPLVWGAGAGAGL